MKKFLITMIILILAAGTVFFFGWVQIQLPPETYSVIFTKTGGYEDVVVGPGDFVWRWQRLIPTNLSYHTFELVPTDETVTISGMLPSGDIYSEFLQGHPNFSWEVRLSMRYQLKPESLPSLVKNENITTETLPQYTSLMKTEVMSVIYPYIIEYINKSGSGNPDRDDFAALEEVLISALAAKFPGIDFHEINITDFSFPDFALYQKGKNYYNRLVDLDYNVRQEEIAKSAAAEVGISKEIEMLREYGKVLTDYPVLMEYLRMKGSFSDLPVTRNAAVPGEGP